MSVRIAAILVLLIVNSSLGAAQPLSPDGEWLRGDGNARVLIAPCGDKLCATNLWIRDTSNGEEVGDKLVLSLNRRSDTRFVGSAYDPKRNNTYSITVSVGARGLNTRGCILFGLLCRDVHWTLVETSRAE